MDKKVLRDISYGMYFVSSNYDGKYSGCVINTLCQITSKDIIVSISLNKDNYTNETIKGSRKFGVSIISNDTKKDVIGKFGYYSSRDTDKFDGINYEMVDGVPVILEDVSGYLVCEVINIVDCGTHDIFIAKVIDGKKINDGIPMTYKYYHENLKGVSPKNAPTYVESIEEKEEASNKYRCKICGFIYDENKENIKFKDLDEEFKCPLCGASLEYFEKI